jgi:hypothetical protein
MLISINHFGLSVNNIDVWVSFFCEVLGLKCVQRREISDPYVSDLVMIESAKADIAMIQTVDGDLIELVQWSNEQDSTSETERNDIFTIGRSHLCLNVDSADLILEKIKKEEFVKFRSRRVVEVTSGPNKGARIFFLEVGSLLYLEIFERPKADI